MKRYKQITQEQRYEISGYLKAGFNKSQIAKLLGFHKSTINKELIRNSCISDYDPEGAQNLTEHRRKTALKSIRFTEEMREIIIQRLREEWSPEQIHGRCKVDNIDMVSHERIYRFIWNDKENGGYLYKRLRNSHKKKKKRYNAKDNRGIIPDRVSIDERPEIVEERSRIGDWEIDTIIGANHKGAIVSIVDRVSKYLCMVKVKNKTADNVKDATVDVLLPIKDNVLTITADNGKEFAYHKKISKNLNAKVYFAHPYHSWERGLNENTNKLIRQYFPKKMPFVDIPNNNIKIVAMKLNNRPRKTLNYKTPNEVFYVSDISEI